MSEKFSSVEDYVDSLDPEVREVFAAIRGTILAALPAGRETISYNIPTLLLDERRVVHYAGWKHHVSLYPAPEDPDLAAELAPYAGGKGTLRFPLERPVPHDLVARVVQSLSAG